MPERGVPTILIDGPSAGQFLYTDPPATAWRVAPPVEAIAWTPTMDYSLLFPEPILYRLDQRTACLEVPASSRWAYVRLRFGWSEPGYPDDQAIRRYGRAALLEHPELIPPGAILWPANPEDDEPIRIIDHGYGPMPSCRDEFQMEPRTRMMRGTCVCGWRTEDVETRRLEELRALTAAHGRAGAEALEALLRQGIYSYGSYAELMGITDQANRRADDSADALRYALDVLNPASRRERAETRIDWGDPVTVEDANWPAQGSTCAHICGADPDHACDARASTRLTYPLPSGGTRSMPICGPCYESETAAKEDVDA
jgi:hypothetical protein